MAIYRASDSLSRCDPNQYSNIYDVRKHSNVKPEPSRATRSSHKDTMEISRDKLKEEALSRLRHTSKYVIAQNSFMRIGKYLFLAVALPPYFVIYGLPKWILVEGIPAIFSMSVWMWKKIQHRTQKQIEVVNRKTTHMLQMLQNMAQIILQPIVQIVLQIRQRIRRFRDVSLQRFKIMASRFKYPFHLPSMKLAQGLKYVHKRSLAIKEKWTKYAQKINTQIQQGIEWIKESPKIIYEWSQLQIQRLNQQITSLGPKWKNRFNTSHQFAQWVTDSVSTGIKKGSEQLKKQFIPLINFYQKQWLPHWHKFRSVCKKSYLKLQNFFQDKHQRSLNFLQILQEKLKKVTTDQIFQSILSHPGLGKLPTYFQELLKKWFLNSIVRNLCDKAVKCYQFSANLLLEIAKHGVRLVAQVNDLFVKSCSILRLTIKTSLASSLSVVKKTQKWIYKSALLSLYYFLLFSTITFILTIWSIRSLGIHTTTLFSYFPLKRMIKLKNK